MLAMGSSLRVNPAAEMALETANAGGNLVIVNLQKTPLDDAATMIIHARIDELMEKLMAELNIQIPVFRLKRFAEVTIAENDEGQEVLTIQGIDASHGPFDVFKEVQINGTVKSKHTLTEQEMSSQDTAW